MASVEVLQDEIDKKKAELREKRRQAMAAGDYGAVRQFDRTAVRNEKDGYVYRGANVKPRRVAELKAQGYEIAAEGEEWPVNVKKDGANETGDVVLMRIPQEKYVERRAELEYRRETIENNEMNMRKENIDRMYRDEMRGKPHTSIVVDESKEEPMRVGTLTQQKKAS